MPHILLGHSMFLVWYPNQPDLSLWMLVYGQVSKTIVNRQHSCNPLWLFQYAQNYQKWPTDYLGQLLSMWSTECCVSNFLWKCFFFSCPLKALYVTWWWWWWWWLLSCPTLSKEMVTSWLSLNVALNCHTATWTHFYGVLPNMFHFSLSLSLFWNLPNI